MRRTHDKASLARVLDGAALLAFLARLWLQPAARPSAAAGSFVVIVNAANPVSSLNVHDVSNAFMKKMARWPNGDEVMPVDLKEQSAVREVFSHEVHEKSTGAVKAYWQKMIFSGRDVPPPELDSESDVVTYVAKFPGAVGYVSGAAKLSGVAELGIR